MLEILLAEMVAEMSPAEDPQVGIQAELPLHNVLEAGVLGELSREEIRLVRVVAVTPGQVPMAKTVVVRMVAANVSRAPARWGRL